MHASVVYHQHHHHWPTVLYIPEPILESERARHEQLTKIRFFKISFTLLIGRVSWRSIFLYRIICSLLFFVALSNFSVCYSFFECLHSGLSCDKSNTISVLVLSCISMLSSHRKNRKAFHQKVFLCFYPSRVSLCLSFSLSITYKYHRPTQITNNSINCAAIQYQYNSNALKAHCICPHTVWLYAVPAVGVLDRVLFMPLSTVSFSTDSSLEGPEQGTHCIFTWFSQ